MRHPGIRSRTRPARFAGCVIVALALGGALGSALAGCAAGAPTGDERGTAGTADAGDSGTSALSCDGVTTGGFGLHRDARVTVQPDAGIVPLASDADAIEFTDAGYADGTTYGWELAYVDGASAFPVQGSFFFDADGGTFRLAGPLAPLGADGGPYAGILTVTATTTTEGTVELAQVCVALAKDG
ncbi:MAG: hypothetical protein J0I43_05910 [Microbacterium sp.]|uniref:hypothetical protein n=1 Tax=Microbacterium sp. TaxID=51671 RepID=UPI001AC52C3D|nr:hypothetical protein [Microbacterium sp.]MBN9176885.1 hypothetical protein [Microbacterium sp.]